MCVSGTKCHVNVNREVAQRDIVDCALYRADDAVINRNEDRVTNKIYIKQKKNSDSDPN